MFFGRGTLKKLIIVLAALLIAASVYSQEANPVDTQAETETATDVDESTLSIGGEAQGSDQAPSVESAVGLWDLVRMVLVLVLVIASIYGLFFLLKRIQGNRGSGVELIHVLSSQNLSGGKSVHLVEVGRQVFLIGSGDQNVVLISEIVDQASLDTIQIKREQAASERGKSFSQLLQGVFGPTTEEEDDADEGSISFLQKQKEKLKHLP